MKTVNLGVYDVYKKHENNGHYDILICKSCNFTCLRNNLPRHKKSASHIAKSQSIVEKTLNTDAIIEGGGLKWEVMAI